MNNVHMQHEQWRMQRTKEKEKEKEKEKGKSRLSRAAVMSS
jgi:hypothetical protein